jgi:hypothetical protein
MHDPRIEPWMRRAMTPDDYAADYWARQSRASDLVLKTRALGPITIELSAFVPPGEIHVRVNHRAVVKITNINQS